MAIVERYSSPDQMLHLVVDLTDGDWSIGFEGYSWHTHGDILDDWGYAGQPKEMVPSFVQDIVSSRREICVYRIDGQISDVAIPDDFDERPLTIDAHAAPNETMEVRYWDGRPVVE